MDQPLTDHDPAFEAGFGPGRARPRPIGRWRRFLEETSVLRAYLHKYRKLVGLGLLSLLVVDLLEILPPIYLKESIDVVVDRKPTTLLAGFAGAYLFTSLVQAIGRYGWRVYLIRSSMLSGRDIRQGFARHLFGLSASFFDQRRIGDLMSLATNDVDAVRMAIGAGLLTLADAMIYLVSVPVVMFWLSPKLAILAFLPLPVVPWIVMHNEKWIHERFLSLQESFSRIAAMAQESLGGVRVIKGFAREDRRLEQFRALGEEYVRGALKLARVQTAFGPTLDFVMSLGLVLLLFVGGRYAIADAVTLGTFVAFQRYIQKMVWPMTAIGMAIAFFQRSIVSADRMKEVLAEATDTPVDARPELPAGAVPGGAWRTPGRIELRDLAFRFPRTEKLALSGIRLSIEPGERVAFVGAVGAGKSALLSLLPRIYPVADGMLFIDGIDANRWPLDELRRQVGYVGQEVFLFSESVVENVAFGMHEWRLAGAAAQLQPTQIQEYTALANVHDDVLGLTEGYGTHLGERGVNLSGGQKQRLTIARALAKQPSILVLDDALSSVDVQTEERILRSLRARPGRNTEIIAAHRISTVKDADRIVVLDGGVIRQVGTHAQLITDRRGAYRRFYEQQRLKEDLDQFIESIDSPGAEAPA